MWRESEKGRNVKIFLFPLNHHISRALLNHSSLESLSAVLSLCVPPYMVPKARSCDVTYKALKESSFEAGSSRQDFCSVSEKEKQKICHKVLTGYPHGVQA